MSRLRCLVAILLSLTLTACHHSGGTIQSAKPRPPHHITIEPGYHLAPVTIIAAHETNPDEMVLDAEYVWWTAEQDIRRVRRSGGTPETFAAGVGHLAALAQDDTHLYVATEGEGYTDDAPLGSGQLIAIAKADSKQRTVLATGLVGPSDIVVPADGDDLYYTHSIETMDYDVETGQVLAVDRRGKGKPRVLVDKQSSPHQLAVDATHLYWTNYGGKPSVARVPRGGGAAEILARELGTPTGLALSADAVYVTAMYGAGLVRVPKTGGEPRSLLGGTGMGVLVDNGQVLVRLEGGLIVALPEAPPAGTAAASVARAVAFDRAMFFEPLAVDGDELYFSSREDGMIRRTSRGGGLLLLAQPSDTPGAVAADDDSLYVLETDNGISGDVVTTARADVLLRIPRDGGGATVLWSTGEEEELTAIAVNATHIYLADAGRGAIVRLAKDSARGAAPETIVSGLHAPLALVAIALDDTHVYFVDAQDGTISRAPLGGGKVEVVVKRPGVKLAALAVTADALLWDETEAGKTTVFRGAKNGGGGGPVKVVVAVLPADTEVVTLTSDTAYILTSPEDQPSALSAVTLADGAVHALDAPHFQFGGLAVSGDSLVFTSMTYQAVLRVTR